VLDPATGEPAVGAEITAGEQKATADADGRFMISGLAPGQYVVLVSHPAYDPYLSGILTLNAGETQNLDVLLSASGTTRYPTDPMAQNQVDPAGAPTAAEAERLARLQGFRGQVASIQETLLDGQFLVNYRLGGSLRAAVATLNHPAWELIDQDGRLWYIVRVCGNLAVARPATASLPPQLEAQPYPVVTVGGQATMGRACASDDCEVLIELPAGWHGVVLACAAECQWLRVQGEGCRGGCWIRSEGQTVLGNAARLPRAPGEIQWSAPEPISPNGQGGPTQRLLLDKNGRLWGFWEEHTANPSPTKIYETIHYRTWNGVGWNDLQDIPGSENSGEPSATVATDGSVLVRADRAVDLMKNKFEKIWFRWDGKQWTELREMMTEYIDQGNAGEIAADGFGNVLSFANGSQVWDGSSWRKADGPQFYVPSAALRLDSRGQLHIVQSGNEGIRHWIWNGEAWALGETIYRPFSDEAAVYASLSVGPGDAIHVVWVSSRPRSLDPNTPTPHRVLYSRWTEAGWTPPQVIMGPFDDKSAWFPAMTVLPDGLIVVVWGDVGVFPHSAVYATWGDGQTWTPPVVIAASDKTESMYPSIAADADGNIHVIWMGNGSNPVYHVLGRR